MKYICKATKETKSLEEWESYAEKERAFIEVANKNLLYIKDGRNGKLIKELTRVK